ncbi:hypothetical protein ACIREO_19465 [Streptomyces sp. NPDC102441]|uniref:hypothetical protein n=1 Tax=Streptomyces sp. NPDC102441 TaxID=3366176 RepID=UPI0038149F36
MAGSEDYVAVRLEDNGTYRVSSKPVPRNAPELPDGATNGVYDMNGRKFYIQNEAGQLGRYSADNNAWRPSGNEAAGNALAGTYGAETYVADTSRGKGPAAAYEEPSLSPSLARSGEPSYSVTAQNDVSPYTQMQGNSGESLSSGGSHSSSYSAVRKDSRGRYKASSQPVPEDAPAPPADARRAVYDVERAEFYVERQGHVERFSRNSLQWATSSAKGVMEALSKYGAAVGRAAVNGVPNIAAGGAKIFGGEQAESYANYVAGGFQGLVAAHSLYTNVTGGNFDRVQAAADLTQGGAAILNVVSGATGNEHVNAAATGASMAAGGAQMAHEVHQHQRAEEQAERAAGFYLQSMGNPSQLNLPLRPAPENSTAAGKYTPATTSGAQVNAASSSSNPPAPASAPATDNAPKKRVSRK